MIGALEKHLSVRDSFGFLVKNILLSGSSLVCSDIKDGRVDVSGFNRGLIGGRLCSNFVFPEVPATMSHKVRAAPSMLQDLSAATEEISIK